MHAAWSQLKSVKGLSHLGAVHCDHEVAVPGAHTAGGGALGQLLLRGARSLAACGLGSGLDGEAGTLGEMNHGPATLDGPAADSEGLGRNSTVPGPRMRGAVPKAALFRRHAAPAQHAQQSISYFGSFSSASADKSSKVWGLGHATYLEVR